MIQIIRLCNQLKKLGIIGEYAIGGGIASLFYIEPMFTQDVDIFITVKQKGELVNLSPIYEYIKSKGYKWQGDHIMVSGYLVQILVGGELESEAVVNAKIKPLNKVTSCRVMPPEYLIAIAVKLGRSRDIYRAIQLTDKSDPSKLREVLAKYDLLNRFKKLTGQQI